MKKITVIGSSNTDMVVKTPHIPAPGETVMGSSLIVVPGGKGANQAVSAAKLGGNVAFVACIGSDSFGDDSVSGYQNAGIDTSYIIREEGVSSGVALISVDDDGENSIVVAPGSNRLLRPPHIDSALDSITSSEYVLIQLEIPMETVEHAVSTANAQGAKVILNPAPGASLSKEVLEKVYLLTPNMSESAIITGRDVSDLESAKTAAEIMLGLGVQNILITMGSKGAYLKNATVSRHIPAFHACAVDTTAAGDVFNGALTVALTNGATLEQAAVFASAAGAISVTRMGAQSSIPTLAEVEQFLAVNP